MEVIEKNIVPYDVYTADEAFMTRTPFCILPTTKLNNLVIGNGKMGKITKLLLDKWSKNVGVNIINQIKHYSEISENRVTQAPSPYTFQNESK